MLRRAVLIQPKENASPEASHVKRLYDNQIQSRAAKIRAAKKFSEKRWIFGGLVAGVLLATIASFGKQPEQAPLNRRRLRSRLLLRRLLQLRRPPLALRRIRADLSAHPTARQFRAQWFA